jgi:hypothetical protein
MQQMGISRIDIKILGRKLSAGMGAVSSQTWDTYLKAMKDVKFSETDIDTIRHELGV